MNPFLESLKPIWANPTRVFLNHDALERLKDDLAADPLPVPDWRVPVFPSEDEDTFINFLGVGNSINFAFTDFRTFQDFSVSYREQTWAGAFAMFACLLRAQERGLDVLNGNLLANLDQHTAEEIF